MRLPWYILLSINNEQWWIRLQSRRAKKKKNTHGAAIHFFSSFRMRRAQPVMTLWFVWLPGRDDPSNILTFWIPTHHKPDLFRGILAIEFTRPSYCRAAWWGYGTAAGRERVRHVFVFGGTGGLRRNGRIIIRMNRKVEIDFLIQDDLCGIRKRIGGINR